MQAMGVTGVTREPAMRFWQELVAGGFGFDSEYCSADRCYGVFSARSEAAAKLYRLPERRLAVLERMIDGQSQKVIAIDMARSDSSIAVTLADCRRRLGVNCRTSAFPLILALTALASRSPAALLWSHHAPGAEAGLRVVSLPRPNAKRLEGLTPAEAEVLALWIEGRSPTEIAESRHACRRTVVNQLATARRKLPVSSRMQLLKWLLQLEERASALPEPIPLAARPALARPKANQAFELRPVGA